ncbi:unnamed protein product [Leuciscus chuanchicus]
MKIALIHALFLLFEICVFVDADIETVSVTEGESVTLHTNVTEIQSSDVIEWRLNGKRIATISDDSINTEERFRDRLKLEKQTGDLMITDIKTTDSGQYKLKIKNSGGSSEKTISVSVVPADPVKTLSVMVEDSLTLNTGVPDPQRDDVIQWRFKNSPIAEINRKTRNAFTSNTDERFRGRLQLDYWTGSMTIRNTETTHSGDYEVDISTSSHTIHKPFNVTVSGELKSALSVMKGGSVTLNSDLTEIQTDNFMQWVFGDSQIADIYKADDRFSTSDGRLKLDHQTGSLTITDTRNTDSGVYELKISSRRLTVLKRFTVTVTDPGLSTGDIAWIVVVVLLVCAAAATAVIYQHLENSKLKESIDKGTILSVMEGEDITLNPDDIEEHKDDKLLWIFRSSCIAVRESAADRFTVYDDLPDGRFRGRLEPDPQTGSLTIPNTRTTDTGEYELLTTRSGKISIKRFSVSVFVKTEIKPVTVSVKKGGSVKLETDIDIQEVEQIQWKFGLNTLLAEITGGAKIISQFAAKILKVKLKLDRQTGSLTIKKIRPADAGIYMLRKIKEGKITTKLFRVSLSESTDNRNNPENVPLNSVP